MKNLRAFYMCICLVLLLPSSEMKGSLTPQNLFQWGARRYCIWTHTIDPFGWYTFTWDSYPWVFHYKLGWFSVPQGSMGEFDDFWFYLPDMGWNWTAFFYHTDPYPWVYNLERGWAYCLGFDVNPNWWYFSDKDIWELRDPLVVPMDFFSADLRPTIKKQYMPQHEPPDPGAEDYFASFSFIVTEMGTVANICLGSKGVKTPESYIRACKDALIRFEYTPGYRDGVAVKLYEAISFRLQVGG